MKHVDVESTLIHSIAYDETERVLEVRFQDGDAYRYFEVEPELVEEWLNADSKGAFFNDHIRDAYITRRVS